MASLHVSDDDHVHGARFEVPEGYSCSLRDELTHHRRASVGSIIISPSMSELSRCIWLMGFQPTVEHPRLEVVTS